MLLLAKPCRPVCPSVHSTLTGRISVKFNLIFSLKIIEKIRISLKFEKQVGTSHEDLPTLMMLSP